MAAKTGLQVADPANEPMQVPQDARALAIPVDPNQAEQDEFAQALKDITSEIEEEFNAKPEVPEEPGDEAKEPEAEAEAKPEIPADKEDPAITRGFDRLIAREVEIKAREDRAAQVEARANQMMAEAKGLQGLKSTKQLQEMASHSLSAVMKELGQDPQTAVRLLLAEQLEAAGKPVPAELKEFARDAAYNRKMAELERKLEEKERVNEAASYFNAVHAGAREYVKTVGDSTPTVKLVAKVNPDRVHSEIMEEITRDAQSKATQDPSANLITYDEAAKRVEARWAELKGVIQTNAPDSATSALGAKTKQPPIAKPPAKPLKPWQAPSSGRDLENFGIDEAIKEFNKQEQLRKRG